MKNISFEDLKGKVCVITGGAGVIGKSFAQGLAAVGVKTVILDLYQDRADEVAKEIEAESGTPSMGVQASVLSKEDLKKAKETINAKFGKIELLINGAGGNSPKATTQVEEMDSSSMNELEKTFYGLEKVDSLDKLSPIPPHTIDSLDYFGKPKETTQKK